MNENSSELPKVWNVLTKTGENITSTYEGNGEFKLNGEPVKPGSPEEDAAALTIGQAEAEKKRAERGF